MNIARTLLQGALLALITTAPSWGQEPEQEKAVDVSGAWEITSESPRGPMSRKVTFTQDGAKLTGTMETRMGTSPIEKGSIEGAKISFTVMLARGDRSFEMTYHGIVQGDTAKGTMQSPRGGDVEWTARRLPKK